MAKEVIKVTLLHEGRGIGHRRFWKVDYTDSRGLRYWKLLWAEDEMDAYMRVMGIRRTK